MSIEELGHPGTGYKGADGGELGHSKAILHTEENSPLFPALEIFLFFLKVDPGGQVSKMRSLMDLDEDMWLRVCKHVFQCFSSALQPQKAFLNIYGSLDAITVTITITR